MLQNGHGRLLRGDGMPPGEYCDCARTLSRLVPWVGVALLGSLVFAGCAHRSTGSESPGGTSSAVDYSLVPPDAGQAYEVGDGEAFAPPRPYDGNRAPVYPPELMSWQSNTVELSARVIVNEAGIPVRVEFTQEQDSHPLFQKAVEEAIMTWRFTPLRRVKAAISEPLPFTLTYRFSFSRKDGIPSVSQAHGHQKQPVE